MILYRHIQGNPDEWMQAFHVSKYDLERILEDDHLTPEWVSEKAEKIIELLKGND